MKCLEKVVMSGLVFGMLVVPCSLFAQQSTAELIEEGTGVSTEDAEAVANAIENNSLNSSEELRDVPGLSDEGYDQLRDDATFLEAGE